MFQKNYHYTCVNPNYNLEKNTKFNKNKPIMNAGTHVVKSKNILPNINLRMNENKFSNNKINQNEQFNPAQRKKSPFTVIHNDRMNLDKNNEKLSGKPHTMVNDYKSDFDFEKGYTKEKEKGKTFVKENKINYDYEKENAKEKEKKLIKEIKNNIYYEKENVKEKSKTTVKDNKNNIDLEIENINEKAKTKVISNNKNIDNNFKISKVKNKQEEKNNIIYNNSISELRLPKELIDISFDNPHNK